MVRLSTTGRAWRTGILAGLLLTAVVASSAVARAAGPGPAYYVEPAEPARPSTETAPAAPEGSATTDMVDPEGNPEGSGAPSPMDTEPPDDTLSPAPPPAPLPADDDPRALSEFATRLAPYGTWTNDISYGTVWLPDPFVVGGDFSPYVTNGHWEVDASGVQAWKSDLPFGDVVFHYGRWVWASAGWAWIPGYRYAPAWVAWRFPTDAYAYVGWSPLPPSFVWMSGVPMALSWRSSYYWVFCPSTFVEASTPSLYVVRTADGARSLARHTRVFVPAEPRRGTPAGTATRMPRTVRTPGAPRGRANAPAAHPASAPRAAPVRRSIAPAQAHAPPAHGGHGRR